MCYVLYERYSACRCLYYKHPVDMCAFYGKEGHVVQERTVLVGYMCERHQGHGEHNDQNGKSQWFRTAHFGEWH
jgi:hypothetical protein